MNIMNFFCSELLIVSAKGLHFSVNLTQIKNNENWTKSNGVALEL